jgi:hypothetical protein
MSVEEQNMELMQTLDDAWNSQDLETFAQRHKPDVHETDRPVVTLSPCEHANVNRIRATVQRRRRG